MAKILTDEERLQRTVYGVGYLGIGEHKARKDSKNMTKEYTLWTNMLSRCYGKPYRDNPRNPIRYAECTVADEWHNFQNFAKWCKQQPNFGKFRYSLDKDLTELGNKVYCPEYCYIVAPVINSAIKNVSWRVDNNLPAGVYRNGNKYRAGGKGRDRNFICPEEAGRYYCTVIRAHIYSIAEQYRDEISEAIYLNLINYTPTILPSSNP